MPTTKPAPPNLNDLPHVTGLYVQFHTNDDDKDADTVLTVSFLHNNVPFASFHPPETGQWFDNYGETGDDYSDNKTTPWAQVPLNGIVLKESLHQSTTTVRIDPNGNDTWRFDYSVLAEYSDRTQERFHFGGHALSEKVRENTFSLQQPTSSASG